MNTNAFDSITRRAAEGMTRRGSLLTLGGAALAATIAAPQRSEAKKKKGKDCKKKEKQRCSNDAAACKNTLVIQGACGPGSDPATCIALQTCCEECSANGFLVCLISASG